MATVHLRPGETPADFAAKQQLNYVLSQLNGLMNGTVGTATGSGGGSSAMPAEPDWDKYYSDLRKQTQEDFERHELGDLQKHFVGRGVAPNSGLATKGKLEARDRVLTPRLTALQNSRTAAQNQWAQMKAQWAMQERAMEQQALQNRLNAMLQVASMQSALAGRGGGGGGAATASPGVGPAGGGGGVRSFPQATSSVGVGFGQMLGQDSNPNAPFYTGETRWMNGQLVPASQYTPSSTYYPTTANQGKAALY